MREPTRIRPFQPTDREYEAVANIVAQFHSDLVGDYEYEHAADLRAFDVSLAGGGVALQRYVAEVGGAIAGYTLLFHIPWLREPGRFWSAIRVHPAHQRHGIGGLLYARQLEELRRLNAVAAWGQVHETTPTLVTYLRRLGCRELFRSWPFSLDARGFDLPRFQHLIDQVAARGICMTTLAHEREHDPSWLPKLYELHAAITRDIPLPGHPRATPGQEWFERYVCNTALALPDAFFIAKDGERYIGESFLHRVEHNPEDLNQKATGVHNDYRGYGIAVALKLATIAYAQQHGYARIWTAVESNNPSMLAINAKLGFIPGPGLIVFEQQLTR